MAAGRLDNDTFFTRLTALLTTHSTSHGSVYLTQKRLFPPSSASSSPANNPENPLADLAPISAPLPILIRATNGKSKQHRIQGEKIKLSTVVQPEDLEGFFRRYAEVMKVGTAEGGLRKRDRSGRKQKDKAKKKKKVKNVGPGEKKV